MDWLEQSVRFYYQQIPWSLDLSYGHLTALGRAALDFPLPSEQPTLSCHRSHGPHLKTSCQWTLPNQYRLACLMSSLNLVPVKNHDEPKTSLKFISSPLLLFGQWHHPVGIMEGVWSQMWLHRHQSTVSWQTSNRASHATLQWQYQHPNQRMAGEWNYSTRGHVMGWRALYRLPSLHWDMGGEVYYTHTEHSGGLSLGLRYRTHDDTPAAPGTYCTTKKKQNQPRSPYSEWTITYNPLMGHLATVYATQAARDLLLATEYRINVHSVESDLSVGLVYHVMRPPTSSLLDKEENKKEEDENADTANGRQGQVVKARWGWCQGFAIYWERAFKNGLAVRMGVQTRWSAMHPSSLSMQGNGAVNGVRGTDSGVMASVSTRRGPRSTLGFEIEYVHPDDANFN